MVRKIQTTLLLLFCLTNVIAQEYYFWANGQKYALELSNENLYVLLKSNNRDLVAQNLKISPREISDIERLTYSKTIVSKRPNRFIDEADLYWGFVNRQLDKEEIKSSEIVYAAPSFRLNDKLVWLSNFFYVKLKQEQDIDILEVLAEENNVAIVGSDSYMPLWFILSCDKNSKGNALEMANLFYEKGNFSFAEPDLMVDYGVNCRNDTFFNQQWHLNNTGQFGGTVGNDTRACQAWDITMGCANIVVAVLDHGLEFNHPDFNNISPISFDTDTGTGPSVVRGNHGVPVAGIIGATANNALGVAGIAPNVQLMSVSNSLLLQPLISQRLANGINFAWQNGAHVINNSWVSNALPQQGLINDAINNAVTQGRGGLGTIVIFSSGNDNSDGISFPATNPQVISVGALSMCNERNVTLILRW
jgi:subtilisin family serine protease